MRLLDTFYTSLNREISWLKSSFWNWGMISFIPLFACLLTWYIFSPQIPHDLPIGVLDQDNTSITRQLTRYLDASPGLHVKENYVDILEAENALRSGSVYAIILIPKDTTQKIKTQKIANIVLHHNAQFGTHSPLIQKDVRTVVGTISAGIEINVKTKKGETPKVAQDTFSPLQNVLVTLFNQKPDYQVYLASALIPTLLHIVAMMTGAYIFGRELRDKTLKQWLANIDLKKISYPSLSVSILGKMLPSIVGFSGIILFFILVFQHAIDAPFWAFIFTFIAWFLFLTLSILIGGYFSTVALSLRKGLTTSSFITAPAFAFSGIGFPLFAMPESAKIWANILPLTHYLYAQVSLLQMGAPYSKSLIVILGFIFFILVFFVVLHITILRALSKPETWGAR
ncbi:ABC transporter permease [Neisseriaceae bacterium PsAf]|nr:ABC transporter permease [Neisseriaceae bacterium PsAf]